MFKALLKTRLQALFSSMFRGTKNKRGAGMKIMFSLLMVYALASIVFLFYMQFSQLALPLKSAGLTWLYFAYAGLAAFALSFIGSVFTTQSQLYDARDNEMLLSLPIKPWMILGSRMLTLLLLNLLFTVLVLAPAGVAFCILAGGMTVAQVACFALAGLAIPVLTMALSSILGWVLALISGRMRNKSLVQTALSVVFLIVYFMVIGRMNEYMTLLIQNSEQIGSSIQAFVFPAYHFGLAAMGSFRSLVYFLLCAYVPFALVYAMLSRTFIRVATSKRGFAKIKYQRRALKVSSPQKALLVKELRHFVSNSMYMMNAGLGVIFTLIIPVLFLIKRDMVMSLLAQIPGAQANIGLIAALILCAMATMDTISAPSISLEGKNLWIAQSLPVRARDILMAKAYMHMVITVPPTLIASAVLALALPLTEPMRLLLIVVPALMNVLFALLGVVINLLFPKFDWVSEAVAVKQSGSVAISMFGGWGMVAAPALLYGLVLHDKIDGALYLFLCGALIALGAVLCAGYLGRGGTKRFAELKT